MSDQYTPQTPMPARPTIAGAGLDPQRSDYRAEYSGGDRPAVLAQTGGGGFSTGILVAIVFVIVAIIAAVVFSNRDMFGIGLGVTPASTPMETTVEPVAPTPAPAPQEPATPPVEAPVGPAPTVTP